MKKEITMKLLDFDQEISAKYLRWSFYSKVVNNLAVNYFRRKTPSQIFEKVLNTFLVVLTWQGRDSRLFLHQKFGNLYF